MRRYGYFPGCSLMVTNRAYSISATRVARELGVELAEVSDWNCCGATAYLALSEAKAFVMSARNLALAEAEGHDTLVAACSGCYVVLRKTGKYLDEKPAVRSRVTKALAAGDMTYNRTVKVRHLLDVLVNDCGEEGVRARVKKPLEGLKVAAYYGCQVGRPFGEADDPEFPVTMDRLMGWLGATTVDFPVRAACCGGLTMTTEPDLGMEMTGRILRVARERGADCIATACPLCQINLEAYQDKIGRKLGTDLRMPVVYFTQLMGRAFGLSSQEVMAQDSLTDVSAVLA